MESSPNETEEAAQIADAILMSPDGDPANRISYIEGPDDFRRRQEKASRNQGRIIGRYPLQHAVDLCSD